ncbi:acyltransferase family protein [Spirosoma endophyticum]|uniref:Peptidoglycan/LPS O-acetylase OafA/YrhL, contains acyltransferase and SGNH-hydrolase domains n=1 Tax=Spirosoma endophyticum TaxID=662367 RepID=A0A1I1PS06_9BACT|nr:acyltransferase [Spirosoma endophyticum]SFD12452.1 Peptidoglycan/LPS O-acetylase OafA/YrhL, contains acyltransferase and SGNH-hydrolase domains [Spirosoma endophyticum]
MKHRFEVLDIFRGIFASMVVLFHLSTFSDTPILNNEFIYNSDMFVDFFFVLSGFVIAYNYQNISSFHELKTFLAKRFVRVYPLHLVMLLIFLVIEASKHTASAYVHVNKLENVNNNIYSFFTNIFLINSIQLFNIQDVSWNIPSWSISAEMISYIVFGLTLVLLSHYKLQSQKGIFFLTIIVLCILLLVNVTHTFKINYSYNYGFLRGIIGFFSGSICYFVFSNLYEVATSSKNTSFTIAEISILIILFLMIYYGTFLKEIGLVYEVTFFIAILIFSFEKGILSNMLKKSSFLKRVGTYSYSIYMTHALLLSLFNIIFIRILKFPPSSYSYLFILNYYIIYKVSQWTYAHVEMRFKIKKQTVEPVTY